MGIRPNGWKVVVLGVVLVLVDVDLVVGRVSPPRIEDSPLFSIGLNVVAVVAKANPKSMPNNGDLVVVVLVVVVVVVVLVVVVVVAVVVVVVILVVVVVVIVLVVAVVSAELDTRVVNMVGDSVVVARSLKPGNMANRLLWGGIDVVTGSS